ncbi:MAG: hypothetical protein KZQ80_16830, partial [Candidatus Thiodiazotropha sp. (ex Monitilora ramsayi)]|nr:hypothetical protein [Candidatus Thiodiazotropha sp. (ex Monitilora ramsayi)]
MNIGQDQRPIHSLIGIKRNITISHQRYALSSHNYFNISEDSKMNKTIIAIALSSTIALAACGKSGDSEMSA